MTEKTPKTSPPFSAAAPPQAVKDASHFQILPPGAEPEQESCAPKDPQNPYVSTGKKIHNEITYRGVDFLLNSAVGIGFTYATARTNLGKKYWAEPITGFFKKALTPFTKNEKALETGASWGSMFTSIIVGGTLIIPPMVALENKKNKKKMVKWLDEKIHGPEAVAADPKFQECYDCIDEEPRKNFTTGMLARGIVLTPMIAATVHAPTNAFLVKNYYNHIAKGSKLLCEKIGIKPKALLQRGEIELADGDITKAKSFVSDWDFIHRTVGFDLGLTFIYSFAHEWTYKALAAVGFKKNEEPEPKNTTQEHKLVETSAHMPVEPKTNFAAKHEPRSFTDFAAKPEMTEVRASL